MECAVKDGRFVGAGDPRKLRALLRCFRAWVEQE
ncbi:Imm53 family immunity protein [Archangium violaceum]